MKVFGKKYKYMDYVLIIIGTGFMAVAINSLFDPSGMVTGGFSGLAIVVKELTGHWVEGGIPLWLTNAVLNIPLFLIGMKIKGLQFLKKTLIGTVALSVWLYILPVFPLVSHDLLLAAVYGGVLQGVGIGMVFLGQGTTGGTDMVAALIQHSLKHYSIAQIMQVVDGIVILVGVYVFGIYNALYAVIAIVIVTKVSDGLMEGLKYSKAAYIITEKAELVAEQLMKALERGATGIHVRGMYSQEEKYMVFCVVSKKQIVQLKEIVQNVDPKAFLIVTDAREVLGEGFIEA